MPVNDELGTRMKEYEKNNRYYLKRKMPVIIRLDMRSGHTFTKGFKRPFDEIFVKSMQHTAKYLCENVQNTKLAYVQSDEITLVLIDYENINTDAFFEYRVDKLCSVTASMATMAFNKIFSKNVCELADRIYKDGNISSEKERKYCGTVLKASDKGAMFDARCFNIPKEEVTNCIYWRQLDCIRNSIQMVGQASFSHTRLYGKTCNMIKDMLMTQKGINWNNIPTHLKQGSCCIKEYCFGNASENNNGYSIPIRSRWIIDKEIPIFKGEDRKYIDDLVFVGE